MAGSWDDDEDYHGSALHSASEDDPRDQSCPTCGEEDVLTRRDVAKGYQCDTCADRAEGKIQYESKKPSLKDYFQQISEDSTAGMRPLPILDPKSQQVGAAVIKAKNPAIQKMLQNLTPQDVQVVQTIAKTGTTSGTPATSTSAGTIQPMKESDEEPIINGKVVDLGSLMIADVDTKDYPDFADAYVDSGSFEDGTEMSDAELEEFQDKYGYLVNQLAHDSLYEGKPKNKYAIGMAAAMKQTGDKPPLKKSTIMKAHEIAKSIKEEQIDEISKAKLIKHIKAADARAMELGRQGMEKYKAGDKEGGAEALGKSGKYYKMSSPHAGLAHKKLAGVGVKVPATGEEPGEVKYVITKVGRTPGKTSGLAGQTVKGITIKDVYTDRAEAEEHAKHLSQFNPVGYEVDRIFDEGDIVQGPWSQGKIDQRKMQRDSIKEFPNASDEMQLRSEITKFLDKLHNPDGQENDAQPSVKFTLSRASARGERDVYSATYELINDEHNDSWTHEYYPDDKSIEVKPYVKSLYWDEEDDLAEGKLNEKWGTETKVAPSEKGKYKGKTKAELLKRYNKLKKSGPHKKGSKEYGTMRELSFAIRAKSGWGKVKEAERPSDQVDMGAGLGAGRSNTVLESNMKKTCQAAYHEGKSHGLGGHAYTCRYDEGTDEHMHYHKGFKEGLDECYGIDPMRGVVDEAIKELDFDSHGKVPATVPGMASQAMDECGMMAENDDDDDDESVYYDDEDEVDEGVIGGLAGGAIGARLGGVSGAMTGYKLGSAAQDMLQNEDMIDEMNKTEYMKHMAKKTPGKTFKAFGQTFSDDEVLESDYTFESLDKQLSALLNEDAVAEGISVSISKGQQGGHDSVSVTATDAEADNLLALVKNAGMGIFADDHKTSDYGAPVSHDGHAEVEDHDSILGIMKKMAGIQGSDDSHDSHDSHDYKQEDDGGCGCGQTPCGCEEVTEEESEDQMEFEVAEDATEVAMTDADEKSEAAEDEALAHYDELQEWANDAMKKGTEEAFTTGDEFMLDTISGGLNKKKSTGQATIPVNAAQKDRLGYNESINDWKKLAGI